MQDIENDMDDLFRRAAYKYPLRLNESDWQSIAQRLPNTAETPAYRNHIAKWLRGLLLLLFFITCGLFASRETGGTKLAIAKVDGSSEEASSANSIISAKQTIIQKSRLKESGSDTTVVSITESSDQLHAATLPGTEKMPINVRTSSIFEIDLPQAQMKKQRKKFYIGIVGGQESNQVKDQALCNRGYDVGFVVGYELNDRFSLETGLLFNRKHYYCNGDDFNMEMPGMKLESLEGKSTLLEIPLKLKYNVIRHRNWNVFSTAGLSSFVLSDEKNNYQLVINGVRQNMTSNYKNSSKYFAAVVDLSVGYELKASERLRLRLQPYLQVPLKGIGVGSIPVKSMGVHAGITRNF